MAVFSAGAFSASAFVGKDSLAGIARTFGCPDPQALSNTRTWKHTHREQEGGRGREESDLDREGGRGGEAASPTRASAGTDTAAVDIDTGMRRCRCRPSRRLRPVRLRRRRFRAGLWKGTGRPRLFQRCSRHLYCSPFHSPPAPTSPRRPTPLFPRRLSSSASHLLPRVVVRHTRSRRTRRPTRRPFFVRHARRARGIGAVLRAFKVGLLVWVGTRPRYTTALEEILL
jgi:hypothetical protein